MTYYPIPVQAQSFSLAGAGASIGDTSIILKSFKDIDGNNLIMADFGTKGFLTLEAGNASLEEQISFSGITQNANGTATLTGIKSVLFITPFTESSGLAKTHAGSTMAIITNTAVFYNAIKDYIDLAIVSGGVPATYSVLGITKMSVSPVAPAEPISVGDNDPRMPTQDENDALAGTGTPSSANKYVTNDTLVNGLANVTVKKFGGTGVDGDLTITSGATNIDLGNAAVVIKNYTSISITGTASLTFTNPNTNGTTIILKSQGNVTLTSSATPMIDASGMGGSGGAAVSGANQDGNNGSNGLTGVCKTTGGGGGKYSGSPEGTKGTQGIFFISSAQASEINGKYPFVVPGSGGGGGASGSASTSGVGGRGGGGLVIECGGAWNFTITNGISVAGVVGTTGTGNQRGAGGGGAGGVCAVFYGTLTANTGTIAVTGGAYDYGNGTPTNGGGGGSAIGDGGTPQDGHSGAGANGYSLVAPNTELQ
jgi:hypothetical protein